MVELTEEQQAAVTAPIDSPLMIFAAAGSGKTLVLCHRILHLISQGVAAKEILAVTFTRRAGQELLHRLSVLSSKQNNAIHGVRVGTFHSFCLSILRAVPSRAGLAPNFIIFTPKMQVELLEEFVREWYIEKNIQISEQATPKKLIRAEAYRLMKQLGTLQRRGEPAKNVHDDGLFKWIVEKYLIHLEETNAIDFGSFIWHVNNILENHPDTLSTLNLNFKHILVDEFQDTDTSQFRLLQALAETHRNITIVGDDDQQIYSWRGATGIVNFAKFSSIFEDAKVLKLEHNFRSTGAIVAAARSVIVKNQNRMRKSIRTTAPTGNRLTMCECRNESCEAVAISKYISMMKAEGVQAHDIVVLYRIHRVGVELKHKLEARGISCRIKSGYGAGDNAKVGKGATGEAFADILAVMRLIMNESDDYACRRLLQLFCTDFSQLSSCFTYLQRLNTSSSLLDSLKYLRSQVLGIKSGKIVDKSILERLRSFQEVLNGLQVLLRIVGYTKEELQKLSMKDVVRNLLQQIGPYREEAGYDSTQKSNGQDSTQKSNGSDFAGVKALLKEAALFDAGDSSEDNHTGGRQQVRYKDMRKRPRRTISGDYKQRLRQFLDQVAIKLHDFELGVNTPSSTSSTVDHPGVVTLSTIHQAKGLEWSSVILARANEGVIPVLEADGVEEDRTGALEEERRLMYVALTRAKSSVLITYLMLDGGQQAFPSRFLSDIPRGRVNDCI